MATAQPALGCSEKDAWRWSRWGRWKQKIQDDSETCNWLAANTKPCPKCGKPVEKNGGCNLVVCKCRQVPLPAPGLSPLPASISAIAPTFRTLPGCRCKSLIGESALPLTGKEGCCGYCVTPVFKPSGDCVGTQ